MHVPIEKYFNIPFDSFAEEKFEEEHKHDFTQFCSVFFFLWFVLVLMKAQQRPS